jgi:hypothetical protein
MVILGNWCGRPITLSLKNNCVTLSVDQNNHQSDVFSFDLAGRLWTAMLDGKSYRRGLDGKIIEKWGPSPEEKHRRWLPPRAALDLSRMAHDQIRKFLADYSAQQVTLTHNAPFLDLSGLIQAANYSPEQEALEITAFNSIYKPVGILPPDQYMSVILQVAEGCSFNTCTFCNFYKGRPFHIKSPQEFVQHCQQIKDFLGAGLSLRRTIFLGDANALVIPMPRLIPLLEITHQHFNVDHLGGIFAFLDGFSGEKKSPQDYKTLAGLGLQRIYIGMESGDTELLQYLKKPGKPEDVLSAVEHIKSAGVAVGIIILAGAGGKKYYRQHVDNTVQIINKMSLGLDDIIYFSELIESENLEYTKSAYQNDFSPLSPAQAAGQALEIQNQLSFSDENGTPHISRYDIREFVY